MASVLAVIEHCRIHDDGRRNPQANSFLYKLLQSACDGVIASDMTGKIILFNDAAVEVTSHRGEAALDHLNIRAIYEDTGAKTVMPHLRSNEYGDKGNRRNTCSPGPREKPRD